MYKKHPFRKVVIWGHKPHAAKSLLHTSVRRHTHSYIHEGFFRAFQFLGFETHWLDDHSPVEGFNFTDCLFLSEDQVDNRIPLDQKATYVIHHSSKSKYDDLGARLLHLNNFTTEIRNKQSPVFGGPSLEALDDVTYFDSNSRRLFQPWATDLLPPEIDPRILIPFNSEVTNVNYVGTFKHDNLSAEVSKFKGAIRHSGRKFRVFSAVDNITSRHLVENSFISIDLRGDWHQEVGYIPCRIWKSLSYGKFIGSNSMKLKEIFGQRVAFAKTEDLFSTTKLAYSQLSREDMSETVAWIRQHHTFVNRASRILDCLE
jgi:hypothetical protein